MADLAIDLGTTNTRIAGPTGDLLEVPTVVAMSTGPRGTELLAVGEAAQRMIGRTPAGVTVIRPVKAGVIVDFEATEHLLRKLLTHVGGRGLRGPRLLVCVPSGTSEVERRAVQESARAAGARQVFLVPTPLVAALGADLPVADPVGSLVVDIGGGRAHVGVISMGGLVVEQSLPLAGDDFDQAILSWVRDNYSLLIGVRTATTVKHHVGGAIDSLTHRQMRVRGRDIVTSTPRELDISLSDVAEALASPLMRLRELLRAALAELPPELAADISQRGMMLCGGSSQLLGLDALLSRDCEIPALHTEAPGQCAARGARRLLDQPELFERVAQSS